MSWLALTVRWALVTFFKWQGWTVEGAGPVISPLRTAATRADATSSGVVFRMPASSAGSTSRPRTAASVSTSRVRSGSRLLAPG